VAWGPAHQDHGLVFCREDGKPIWPRSFSRSFDLHVRDAGLPKIRLHDLRHTHATLALEAGVHPKVVQERLGRHSTIAITLDTYSHAIPAMQEDAAAKIAALPRV
jgi:integrase